MIDTAPFHTLPPADPHKGGFWVEFMELLTNPAHWAFGLVEEAASGLILAPVVALLTARWIRRHDSRHHE